MRRLSFEASGCRAVQMALGKVDRRSAARLAAGLEGHVARAVDSPHANYVLQKIISVLSPQEVPFLTGELSQCNLQFASHKYGCRVYCRLLETAAAEDGVSALVDEVLQEAEQLVSHPFGHHVVECALEHGLPHQRRAIIAALRKNPLQNARNRPCAYVVEKALLYGTTPEKEQLALDLVGAASDVAALARGQYGSMVLRAVLRLSGEASRQLKKQLLDAAVRGQLQSTKHGRRVLGDPSCTEIAAMEAATKVAAIMAGA